LARTAQGNLQDCNAKSFKTERNSWPQRGTNPTANEALKASIRLRQGLPAYGGAEGDQGFGGQVEAQAPLDGRTHDFCISIAEHAVFLRAFSRKPRI
jgi:hypothetical protein